MSNKFLNFNKVLCLSPHPDDVEYSMAGSMLKFKDTRFDILCLSRGGDYDITSNSKRLVEMENCWSNALDNTNIYLIENPEKNYITEKEEDEWIHYIEKECIKNIKEYDCIFCPNNIDSHFKHRLTHSIANALIRSDAISLIEYFTPSTLDSWVANLFVNISDFYDTKLLMLKEFKSQQHKSFFNENSLNSFHSHYQATKRKIKMVEKFNIKVNYIL